MVKENRKGATNSVAVLTNPKTKEVVYIPSKNILIEDNYTLGNLLEDVKQIKENYNKLIDILMADSQEVIKNEI